MRKFSDKEIYYLSEKWPGIRDNKRRYIIRFALFWGVPYIIVSNLFRIFLFGQDFQLSRLVFEFIFVPIISLWFANTQFKGQEKRYQEYLKSLENEKPEGEK